MTAIEACGLTKRYEDVVALAGLTLSVEPGTVFGLLGPNGAGKSTTVKILTTLSRADAGSARVAGYDVVREPQLVRRSIGVVAQRSGVDREATGRENLRLQGAVYGLPVRDLERRVDELLERFGLAEAADRLVRTYSGGMQRKLDVALGLIHRPAVLFLDEPTTGLDPEARAELWEEIDRLAHDEGMTVLLTTHYLEEADRLADRLAIVDGGKVIAEGTPERLKGELAGDTIRVELVDGGLNGRVHSALEHVDVHDLVLDGRELRAQARNGAEAAPALLQALDAAGVEVASLTVAGPTLDDVYLLHAGRRFAGNEKE